MTERKPPDLSFESWVEAQIGEAMRQGEFDNLRGAGKPLPGLTGRYDEDWWLKSYIAREKLDLDPILPPAIRLRKEIDRLREAVARLGSEQAVRAAVAEINRRVRESWPTTRAPLRPVRLVNADAVVEQWRADRAGAERERGPAPVGPQPTATSPPPSSAGWWRGIVDRLAGRARRG